MDTMNFDCFCRIQKNFIESFLFNNSNFKASHVCVRFLENNRIEFSAEYKDETYLESICALYSYSFSDYRILKQDYSYCQFYEI